MKCTECDTSIILGHVHDGRSLCSACKLKIDPPTMEFKQCGKGNLYSVALEMYERYMHIEDFEKCGWFLQRKTEEQDKGWPGQYNKITHYYLIYLGEKACHRCGDFSFPKYFRPCHNLVCVSGDTYDC